jgi:hypothetical protein
MNYSKIIKTLMLIITSCMFSGLWSCSGKSEKGGKASEPLFPATGLELVDWHDGPVLTEGDPGTEDIRHGIEGGTVIKQEGIYHLFTSEQTADPKWVKMRLGHWKSEDGIHWERVSTLYESSGDYTGTDPRAALWSPMPTFNEADNRWYFTYVAYKCKPDTKEQFLNNYEGRIWMAKSEVPGKRGIGGPYKDVGIIMEPGPGSDEWEGLQGTDSFYAFRAGGSWLAFYGSAKTERLPMSFWGVGLARSDDLQGPWTRLSERNPTDFRENFSENPIVTLVGDSVFIAVMDAHGDGFGYSLSYDGLNWSQMYHVPFSGKMESWWSEVRTPLCLIGEKDGTFTVFFTATKEDTEYWNHIGEEGWVLDTGFDSMGKISVRIITG